MGSTYTVSHRFELQGSGENLNSWGTRLNTALTRIDFAVAGLATVALTGNYTLTASNTATDEARAAILKFTGGAGPFTVTIPGVQKPYRVWNATTGPVTLTTGAGATVVVDSTDIQDVFCDGVGVYTSKFGGQELKDYIASVATGGPGSVVPSVTGNAGKYLGNNGTATSWAFPVTTDLSDLAAYTAAQNAFAVAMAVAFSST